MGMEDGCKVCRVLSERGLEHYNERMVSMWTGEERVGYRQLARWLNVRLLRREMDRAGLPTLGEEAESKYERLQDDDATSSEVENMLRSEGLPVDKLQNDFVSYGVIRTHLKDCLDAEYEPQDSGDWESEAVEFTKTHAYEKIEDAVRSLQNKNQLEAGGEVSLHIEVKVECEECQTRVPLSRAIRRGAVCDCAASTITEVNA